jgi:pseudaminic acid cytidylyltransferase
MSTIAIIPARSGSKRIPNKNFRDIAGKPAIAYPIKLAIESGLFDQVFVSTDSEVIANIAQKYGASIPFTRSKELSDDFATTVEVISDAVERLGLNDSDQVCCIYPVTPLLRVKRLIEAQNLMISGSWDYVFLANEYTTPVERSFRKDTTGKVHLLNPDHAATRTQDIPNTYYDAGQFYFGKAVSWRNKVPILTGNSTFIPLEKYEAIDIDDESDWKLLERIIESR